MVNPVDIVESANQECKESSWEIIFLLRENGYLKDPESMTMIQKYLLECCRRIWDLIPDSGSRKGVEAAEKTLPRRDLMGCSYRHGLVF